MVTQEQIKDISNRIDKLKVYLNIDQKLIEINNEEEKTVNPNFWNNPKEAEAKNQKKVGKRLQNNHFFE
jgi:peptide chain release factor 2